MMLTHMRFFEYYRNKNDIPIAPSLYRLSNKMDNSLLSVRDINHIYIVVES